MRFRPSKPFIYFTLLSTLSPLLIHFFLFSTPPIDLEKNPLLYSVDEADFALNGGSADCSVTATCPNDPEIEKMGHITGLTPQERPSTGPTSQISSTSSQRLQAKHLPKKTIEHASQELSSVQYPPQTPDQEAIAQIGSEAPPQLKSRPPIGPTSQISATSSQRLQAKHLPKKTIEHASQELSSVQYPPQTPDRETIAQIGSKAPLQPENRPTTGLTSQVSSISPQNDSSKFQASHSPTPTLEGADTHASSIQYSPHSTEPLTTRIGQTASPSAPTNVGIRNSNEVAMSLGREDIPSFKPSLDQAQSSWSKNKTFESDAVHSSVGELPPSYDEILHAGIPSSLSLTPEKNLFLGKKSDTTDKHVADAEPGTPNTIPPLRPTRDTPTRFDPDPAAVTDDDLFDDSPIKPAPTKGTEDPSSSPKKATETSNTQNTVDRTQETPSSDTAEGTKTDPREQVGPLINFRNVRITEYINFISKITGKNFIYDEEELNFRVTIVSSEPTTIDNIIAALIHELRIHNLALIEVGNNLIIHPNESIRNPGTVVTEDTHLQPAEMITRIFRLNNTSALSMAEIIRPMLSDNAIVESIDETGHVIITDLASNVEKIEDLLSSIDSPSSGFEVGQYVVRNATIDAAIELAETILSPIAQGRPLVFVPHAATNSVFIVSTPFLVERAIGILQQVDTNRGSTRILSIEKFTIEDEVDSFTPPTLKNLPEGFRVGPGGELLNFDGNPLLDENGNPLYLPPGWRLNPDGTFTLPNGDIFDPQTGKLGPPTRLSRLGSVWGSDLPLGHSESTKFYIYKLQYRRGDEIRDALKGISDSLQDTGAEVTNLISTVDSIEWIESSNSLVFTGTIDTIRMVKELIKQVDVGLRQVLVEMLILETTIDDSLSFGVEWGSRYDSGESAGSQGFFSTGSPLPAALDTTAVGADLNATTLARDAGFSLGVIGRNVTWGNLTFGSLGALVSALHTDSEGEIVMNPKIVVEENSAAEIFVGVNTRFQTQSIANNEGNLITSNFEFRDVGSRLTVTPQIGQNDLVTLDIEQELSTVIDSPTSTTSTTTTGATGANATSGTQPITDVSTTREARTSTRVHVPNGYFVILSGMIQDERTVTNSQVPCLGGIPGLGAAFRLKRNLDAKRNLMIFIRPQIVEDQLLLDNTMRQQGIYEAKSNSKKRWEYEADQALDLMNLKDTCGSERY